MKEILNSTPAVAGLAALQLWIVAYIIVKKNKDFIDGMNLILFIFMASGNIVDLYKRFAC